MVGTGLKRARIRKGWTLRRLANEVSNHGLPTKAHKISEYEKGKSFPSASFLLLAASVLNVPSTYFMHVPKLTITWRAFRKRSGFGKRSQGEIMQYATDLTELYVELKSLLNPAGEIDFPAIKSVTDAMEAEYVAGELRARWNIGGGPIQDLVRTVEDCGAVVIAKDDTSAKFDGLSGWCGEYPVIVINSNMSIERQRFTVAHEIGHLIMDTSAVEDDEELLANRFAASFLAPAEDARRALGESGDWLDWDDLKVLKQEYGLSMSAWVRRAYDLDIIKKSRFVAHNRDLRGRGWYAEEPGQYDGDEEPMQLKRMTELAISQGAMSIPQLSAYGADFLAPATDAPREREFPSATELIQMDEAERDCWMTKMFELAEGMDFEVFEAFGEEEF